MAEPTVNSEKTVLVLQGGGALGAYQGGAYEAPRNGGDRTRWVAGISIGAVNSAIIAGNPPERRVERLREFLGACLEPAHAAAASPSTMPRANSSTRRAPHLSRRRGRRAFSIRAIRPRSFMPPGTIQAISVYDTSALKDDASRPRRLRSPKFRTISASASARSTSPTGNLKYFDSTRDKIGPEHIMASGALPPGFPPVAIDGQLYWDGGLVSNTPLQYVLDGERPAHRHVRFSDRSLQRQGARFPKRSSIVPAAREGDPLFEPHALQHRRLPRDADDAPRHSPA